MFQSNELYFNIQILITCLCVLFILFPRLSMATVSQCTHLALLILLIHFLTASPATQDDLVIKTRHGAVQGKLLSVLGGHVRAFLGIPYGKPPLGKLRFRAPEPVEGWEGVRDATKFPNCCYQMPDTAYPGRTRLHGWTQCIHITWHCDVVS